MKIAYLLASVASDIFALFTYKQSMWIEHSHVADQWKAIQIFNLVCLVAFCFVADTIFEGTKSQN